MELLETPGFSFSDWDIFRVGTGRKLSWRIGLKFLFKTLAFSLYLFPIHLLLKQDINLLILDQKSLDLATSKANTVAILLKSCLYSFSL